MWGKVGEQINWKHTLLGGVLAAGLLLSACQAPAAGQPLQTAEPPVAQAERGEIPVLTITATDHAFALPEQIEAGLVTIHLKNEGQEPHHAQLLQLNEGVTMEQFGAALREDVFAGLALVTMAGGPGPVEPGGEQRVTVELHPGQHLIADFLPGADGIPHIAKGMIGALQVVESDAAPAQAPQVDGEVTLLDFSFTLPETIRAGEQTWKVTANGQQPHELSLIKLAEGKTMADVEHWMHQPEGAPPFINAGGLQAIDPGESGYLHLNLEPGTYVAICHLPDPASGQEHAALGMILPFTVN